MNKEEFYSIGRGSLNLNGKFYCGLDYAITDFMRNIEKENTNLKQALNEIREICYGSKKFEEDNAVDTWYCSQECSQKADIQEEYETYEKEEIKCPHCEQIYSDDLDREYQADGDIFECPNCGEEFLLSAYTSTSFTAIPTKEQIDKIYEERNDRPL